METKSINILTELLGKEFYAERAYTAMAIWFENAGFLKWAAFCREESIDERSHAQKIIDYFTGWDVAPSLPFVPELKSEYSGVMAVAKDIYAMEYALYEMYGKGFTELLPTHPDCAMFLAEFMEVQRHSVAKILSLISVIEGIDGIDKAGQLTAEKTIFN